MAAPPSIRASPPVLPDELVEEILLRLPPHDPACLLRASVVCKAWGSAISHPSFRRRIHELHRTPPLLGFLHDWDDERVPDFVPTTASAFSLAAPDRRFWRALDCRHGRALFLSRSKEEDAKELLLWEPITGAQQRVPVPPAFHSMYADVYPSAAVFCGADECGHRDCHGGPFRVAFVFNVELQNTYDQESVTSACVYSSETGTWGELTSMHCQFLMDFGDFSSVLVGRSLLYFMSNGVSILEYDWARNELTDIGRPDTQSNYAFNFTLVLAQDGGLGLVQNLDSRLKLWSREGTDARWVLSRVIYLGNLLPVGALVSNAFVLGFAEIANVIFVHTVVGLFTIDLLSERVRKVGSKNGFHQLIPVVGFYTPVSQNEQQVLPLLNASVEERGEEEEEEEEKTVNQGQQLFDNGSNAI